MGERAQAEVAERVGHTPGPWTLTPDVDGFWIGNDGENAARVYGFTDHPRNMANAYLVSAAPDMLAALVDLVTDDEGWRDRNRPEYQERLAAARAAIAKAEGR